MVGDFVWLPAKTKTRKEKMNQLTSYEITFILKDGEASSEIKKVVENNSAKIVREDDLGTRTLAYPIKKATSGHYFRIVFDCAREDVSKIDKELRKETKALRFIIVNALRQPKEGERRPDRVGKDSKTLEKKPVTKISSPVVAKAKEEPIVPEKIESNKEEKEEKPESKPEKQAVEVKEEKTSKAEEKTAPEKKVKRVVKKATKITADELDKKLEELVKED